MATASQATGSMGLNGNEVASPEFIEVKIPEPLEPFESDVTCIIQSFDQYEMQKQMSTVEDFDVEVILNDKKSFTLKGNYVNVEKAIEQLMDLKNKKLASKNTTEENKERTSDYCDAAKRKERKLLKDLTPSIKQVDLSLSQKVPIDQYVWYFLERKHPNRVNDIATKHLCISRFVCESSNEGITHSLEVVPFYREKPDEAKKYVEDAVEEFAQLYQKVSGPGIVKENIKLPLPLNKGIPQQLIVELEEACVFFLRSDDEPCLVGPKACIEEAKQKVSDFISRHSNSPTLTQPNDDIGQAQASAEVQPADSFGLAQASAEDRVGSFTFMTPSGLTVHVSKGDLVHQELDAIVNPANERLGNGGGAARAIAKAAGYNFQRECDEKIRKNGELDIACVMHTSAGNLRPRIKYVIHTVGPKNTDAEDDEQLLALVRLAIFNCISYANGDLKVRSLAIPAISSGIFGVPIEIVGRASYEALIKFDEYCASSKNNTVREIYFLNKDEPTFSNMKRIFQSLMAHESSVDPAEHFVHATEALDRLAEAFGRERIETTPNDNCFTRAVATALQRDFRSELDWKKVGEVIRKELDDNKDHYKKFLSNKWSWADFMKDPWDTLTNMLSPGIRDKNIELSEVWISAAANALHVQIVLVQLSETQVSGERNFKPNLCAYDDSVYIAHYCCGHHQFDALVKKTADNDSGWKMAAGTEGASAEIKNKSLSSGHSHDMNNGHWYTDKMGESFVQVEKTEIADMPQDNVLSNVGGKNAVKENPSDVAGKKAGNKANDNKKDDDDNHCIICMDNITDKKELPCKHKFCRECIDEYFSKGQPKCPSCGKVFGTLRGDQPKGTMRTQENNWQHLPGYHDFGTIEINYSFNNGLQGDNHPNPGQPYRGTQRTAYLPANKEGREVLRLLKRAFDAGLVFTIGQSNTTGQNNVVIWNDVHHKTSVNGQYGYPDATYLKRVKEELAAKGIQ